MATPKDHSADASTTAITSPSKLRQRTRILAAQNDTAHPRIDNILASNEHGHDQSFVDTREENQTDAKAVSTARPTSPLMPIVRSLERLGEKVPSLPKLPASNIEVKYVPHNRIRIVRGRCADLMAAIPSFAPLQVPRQRRIQTAVVATWSLMLPICFVLFFFLWQVHLLPLPSLTVAHPVRGLTVPCRSFGR